MWALLWRRFIRVLREERGAALIWWWGAETASEVLASFGLVAFVEAVFAHERATLSFSSSGRKPKGAKLPHLRIVLVP